jgi:hypothetical protein
MRGYSKPKEGGMKSENRPKLDFSEQQMSALDKEINQIQ